jgi:hypothetical protein
MQQPTDSALLHAWEQGRHRHPLDRGLLLYAIAATEEQPDTLADRPLGQKNAALLRLRQALFGDALSACLDCPRCAERLEFSLCASELLAHSCGAGSQVEIAGLRFRLPTTRDLARIAREPDSESGAQRLLVSLLDATQPMDDGALLSLTSQVATALEQTDPGLDFALNLHCPQCEHDWTNSFDIASYLWEEIDARSRRLLDEVHVLARAYGWSEREILSLTDVRRAAYLERALA